MTNAYGNKAPLIEMKDVTRVYGIGDASMRALKGISLSVFTGDFVAVMGASGSGKSTCLNILGCLDTPTSGSYLFEGVAVTERTREIGTRLAIGALSREVLLQFLVEAVMLSSLGGALGIVLALAASAGLAKLLLVPFVVNPGIIILAFVFSAAIGIFFGYFPARNAARLDPIDALRHE